MSFFCRFADITDEYGHTDKHIHSQWGDGQGTITQIVRKSWRLGLNQIAITEHVRLKSRYFSDYAAAINKIKAKYPIQVLIGFEAKVKNLKGEIDVSKSAIKQAQIKIASVHRFPIGKRLYYPEQLSSKICQEIELELSISALKKRVCNVLGHPGGMSLRTYNEFPLEFFEKLILECKRNDIAFELNSAYHNFILSRLKTLLRKHNPFVSIGSDAHRIQDIGSCVNLIKGNG